MPSIAIDKSGREWIYEFDPDRIRKCRYNFIELPSGTIEKILGKKINVKGMPVKLK